MCGWLKGDANRRSRSVWPLDLIVGLKVALLPSSLRSFATLRFNPDHPSPSHLLSATPTHYLLSDNRRFSIPKQSILS